MTSLSYQISEVQRGNGRPCHNLKFTDHEKKYSPFCPPQVAQRNEEPERIRVVFLCFWLLFFPPLCKFNNFPCWSAAVAEVRSKKGTRAERGQGN